ncbi:hypothetical protein JCM10212_002346 [Sporobolomyces blumeae]
MNAHHKKASYRSPPPRAVLHHSQTTLDLPFDGTNDRVRASNALRRAIERVPFGWQLDVVVPETATSRQAAFAQALRDAVQQEEKTHYAQGVNLADLLEPEFMNAYVRTGSLIALSLEAEEGDDVVAIDGRGRLILSVSKYTYEVLGLPGRASMFGSFRRRFIVEISLIDPAFRAGKPGFERVKRLLRNWPRETALFEQLKCEGDQAGGKTFDLLMSYVDENGVPQNVDLPKLSRSRAVPTTTREHTLPRVAVPKPALLPSRAPSDVSHPRKRRRTSSGAAGRTTDERELWWDQFREWRGLASIGSADKLRWSETGSEDGEDGEWGVEREDCVEGSVTALSWNGLLHPMTMLRIVERATQHPDFSSLPFLSISLRPFTHAPISHTSKQNPPVLGTSMRPNGKKRKRGRGRGEEEEADRERQEDVGGWDVVLRPRDADEVRKAVDCWVWEGQRLRARDKEEHFERHLSSPSCAVALIGCGLVGKAVVEQLTSPTLSKVFSIVSLTNSKHTVTISPSASSLDAATLLSLLPPSSGPLPTSSPHPAASYSPANPQEVVKQLAADSRASKQHTILVDCTSDLSVTELYPLAISSGLSVVTPNKKGFSSNVELWNKIVEAQSAPGAGSVFLEATVGAGLPIISTLRDMLKTGDEVTKIEGVFSGTFSYIFNNFSRPGGGGPKFSEVVKIAKDNGYTEPHPADDLSGSDVARKLTILSRLLALQPSTLPALPDLPEGFASLSTQSLIPSALASVKSGEEFVAKLPEFDAEFDQLRADAEKEGMVLRYVGLIDRKTSTVKCALQKYPASHPFASALSGSDNIVSFHSKRYPSPLTVQGSGAGADVTAAGVVGDAIKVAERYGVRIPL